MSQVTASAVGEGQGKPVRRLSYVVNDATPSKGSALVALSREVAMQGEVQRTARQELARSIAQWTDGVMLTACSANTDSSAAVSNTFDDFAQLLIELLQQVKGSSASRMFLVVPPAMAKAVAGLALAKGLNLSWPRFEIAGVVVVASDAQAAGTMTLIDSAQLAMRLGEVTIRTSESGTLEMDTSPTQSAATSVQGTSVVSLWQTNTVAVLCERSALIEAITDQACASFTGITIGDDGGSPRGI
jgi:hypothetical protein